MPRASRRNLFRLLAVLLGLSLVGAAELTCRALGWGLPEYSDDPFVGFEAVVPLFVPSDDGRTMQIAPGRLKFFAPESFPVRKTADTYRIFCFGGSTVQGRPFSTETAFTIWLRQSLEAADPTRNWEVINCGGVSYASYRLVPILQECLGYQPDAFVLCTGHNEFLEDRTYGSLRRSGSLHRVLGRSRLYTVLRAALRPERDDVQKFRLAADVQARLDFQNGLDLYERDDTWQRSVVRHFETNLRRMVEISQDGGVPLMVMLPPSNLADSPPFKSVSDSATKSRVQALVRQARGAYATDRDEAIRRLTAAVRLDPRCAAILFELGRVCEAAGRIEEARRWFIRARDEDVCPLRMISPLEDSMRRVVAEYDVPFVDAHVLLESVSRSPILGYGLLVDHIHPSFRGHQLIAHELLRQLERLGVVNPAADWETKAEALHRDHFASLDRLYFLRGQRTLENLKAWARGRGHNLPPRPGAAKQQPAADLAEEPTP